jgi:hypothetical protein
MQPPRSYCLASYRLSLGFVVALCVSCGDSAGDDEPSGGAGKNDAVDAGKAAGSGGSTGSSGSGGTTGTPDAGKTPVTMKDTGPTGGNDDEQDGGESGPDAGPALNGMGSCCAEHDTPGCSNPDLQVCVCELLPSCCTDKWEAACTYLVQQKYCQEGVRDCVCGTDTNADPKQWGQTRCCNTEWSSTCDSVAELKCGAIAGCF